MAREELEGWGDFTNADVGAMASAASTKKLSDLVASRKKTKPKEKEDEKSRLGELEGWGDFTDANVGVMASPESTKSLMDLVASRKKVAKGFDPNQPRVPAGSPEGGQFVGYHGTSGNALDSIFDGGLLRNPSGRSYGEAGYYRGARGRSVYLTPSLGRAIAYANEVTYGEAGDTYDGPSFGDENTSVVLEVRIPSEHAKKLKNDEQDSYSVRFEGDIPPDWIVAVHKPGDDPVEGPWRRELVKSVDDYTTVYVVVDLRAYAQEHGIEKYDPSQPREPKGTPEGGQFASRTFPEFKLKWDVPEGSFMSDKKQLILEMFGEFADAEPNAVLSVRKPFSFQDDATADIKATLTTGSKDGYYIERTFTLLPWERQQPDSMSVIHTLCQLPASEQNKGAAKRFLRDSMRVYEKMGNVSNIRLNADLEVGSYAWAKYGFVPQTSGDWNQLARNMRPQVEKMPKSLMRDRVEQILNKADPKAIWDLADLTIPYNGQPVGKYLLLPEMWPGYMKVRNSDPAVMERFWNYVNR